MTTDAFLFASASDRAHRVRSAVFHHFSGSSTTWPLQMFWPVLNDHAPARCFRRPCMCHRTFQFDCPVPTHRKQLVVPDPNPTLTSCCSCTPPPRLLPRFDERNRPGAHAGPAVPEICASGLRNPWRCGFDRDTDVLYCGDVGHYRIEEVDIIE